MELVARERQREWAARSACRRAYQRILAGIAGLDTAFRECDVEAFERAAAGLATQSPAEAMLWRARVAMLRAHVASLLGADATPHARRAAAWARQLLETREVPPDAAYGVLSEAYVSLCGDASTPRRILLYERARSAARRALALNPDQSSAHYAMGLQYLFTPRAFGGSPARAAWHLGAVIEREPSHYGARMALAESHYRCGDHAAFRRELRRLREAASPLAAHLERRLEVTA